ncbi:hypothetical protein [Actinosynnema mirum]|uniref:Uncharacterized protein n=1 Tax=Actinosynnema mirum (strain ATCC 29888 / DSM 43827 / JCM 3225 / NBRC 14064 / NCIMB 13271 / NRRL B-12336 / IMRU 3971 / 101) TaxID=446462 RepID=C6WQ07_ACTMD|nr:hypothetical protein [Actinosynnema mirum]ACU35063.1 hypothetical protein Amir_1107 [Actinosynnema mirum DSM 43827]
MAVIKERNRLLEAVMRDAGVSNKGLAARVRELAARDGETVAADHVSVKRWLDGTNPKPATQQYIALALGGKLGREVTPEEIGFSAGLEAVGPDTTATAAEYPADSSAAVDLLGQLTAADLEDQPGLTTQGWTPAVTPKVITGYLFGDALQADEEIRTGAPAAAAIRTTAAHLMDLDFRFGGGHVRKMLLFYFKSEIAPLLRADHPVPVRRELFSAAAEVAQLLGWSAYDAGRQAAAQRYFTQGLRLAREAGDAVVGGRLLSNLSHQANYLGKFNDAIQLARAAQTATRGVATPAVNSMFLAMEARGLAGSGDAKEFARVLAEAERSFGQHRPEDEPEWARYFNAEELAGEAAHCFRDLGRAEETRLYAARAIAPEATPPRTRAFIGMVTAAGALTNGDLDEAVTLALDAVDLAGPLQSSRYVRYLTDFHERLTAVCPRHPLVLRFAEEIVKQYPTLPLGSAVVLSRVA